MPPKPDANQAASSTAENGASNASPERNQAQTKPIETLVAEHKAEYDRKHGELKDTLTAIQDRLEDLAENRGNLTASERHEVTTLGNQADTLEAQLAQIESHPDNRLFYTSIDRRIERKAKEAEDRGRMSALVELQKDFLEEQAVAGNMTYDALVKELRPFAAKYESENPYRKAKLAMRDLKKHQEFLKKEAELARKEAELNSSAESGDRAVRNTGNLTEAIQSGDLSAQAKHLGL